MRIVLVASREPGWKRPPDLAVNFWVRDGHTASISFDDVGRQLTCYSFLEVFAQDEHERLLLARLAALRVDVERDIELVGFVRHLGEVWAELRAFVGKETCRTATSLAATVSDRWCGTPSTPCSLAMVLANRAPDALLDSYEAERKPFARTLVRTTGRVYISQQAVAAGALSARGSRRSCCRG